MKIIGLKIKHDRNNIQFVEQAYLKKDKGFVGDSHGTSGDRQISILSFAAREKIDSGELEGLCTLKFHENITLDGLDVDKISVGERLGLGDAIIEITSKGKRCFKECKLYEEKKGCLLSIDIVFGKVIESGIVTIGDKIIPLG